MHTPSTASCSIIIYVTTFLQIYVSYPHHPGGGKGGRRYLVQWWNNTVVSSTDAAIYLGEEEEGVCRDWRPDRHEGIPSLYIRSETCQARDYVLVYRTLATAYHTVYTHICSSIKI